MKNIIGFHEVTDAGNPVGGKTTVNGISIDWSEAGATLSDVILAVIDRAEFLQTTNSACLEYQIVIANLRCALANIDLILKKNS